MPPENVFKLLEFYKPFNKLLFELSGKDFGWNRRLSWRGGFLYRGGSSSEEEDSQESQDTLDSLIREEPSSGAFIL